MGNALAGLTSRQVMVMRRQATREEVMIKVNNGKGTQG